MLALGAAACGTRSASAADVSSRDVHDLIPESKEPFGRQRLSEEVGQVICGGDVRYLDMPEFYELTDIEVPTFDVLSPGVMLRVISKITRGFVITGERNGKAATEADFVKEIPEISGLFGSFR